jgi:hypothetical protein
MALEVIDDPSVDGSTIIVSSKFSLNLISLTLEQVLSRRRRLLLDMVKNMRFELRKALANTGFVAVSEQELDRQLGHDAEECELHLCTHKGVLLNKPEWFNEVRLCAATSATGHANIDGCAGCRAAGP